METIVANIKKELITLSKRYVHFHFYGSKRVKIEYLWKLYNLIQLAESSCITLNKKLKKIYAKYD